MPSFMTNNNPQDPSWGIPFVMAGVNYGNVKRSNALLSYGNRVTYRESMVAEGFMDAWNGAWGLALMGVVMFFPPLRWLAYKLVLPAPGQGPSDLELERNWMLIRGLVTSTSGETVEVKHGFLGDPGYRETARMLVEC